jgi:nucleotide-binding universal stress UspA family protein
MTTLPLGAIVVGIDGNPNGMYAAAWAARQADLEQRPLVVVHAVDGGPHLRSNDHELADRVAGQRHAERAMHRALEVAPKLRVQTLVRSADPAELLVELGEAAHLLVVGSRGLGRVASLIHGSVSLAVCASASCPVIVVREEAPRPRRIVVGTDGTEASAAAVDFAFAQASLRGVPLTVLHAVSILEPRAGEWVSAEAAAPAWLSQSVAGLREKYIDVDVELQVAEGPTVVELTEASLHAELVVLGSRPHRGPLSLNLTSVSRALLDHGHCSIGVVRRLR